MKLGRKCVRGLLFTMILFAVVMVAPVKGKAAKVELSKTSLNFASPKAKAQTITIKGVKASNIKDVVISDAYDQMISIKRNGNKLVIKPKRSANIKYGLSVTVYYKQPVDGSYQSYLTIKKIKVKGSSQVPIKTADDLLSILSGSYTEHKWKYYLAADIDMRGKGYPGANEYSEGGYFSGVYIDGKGHKIKLDTPLFESFDGTLKNVVFDLDFNCTVSKNDDLTKIWNDYYTLGSGIGPIIRVYGGTISGCKTIGNINVKYDTDLTWMPVGGTEPSTASQVRIGGITGENSNSSRIEKCKSEVNISVDFGKYKGSVQPMVFVGGITSLNYGYSGNSQYATISECEFSGNIEIKDNTTFTWAGGICAQNNAHIYDCLNTGSVNTGGGSFNYGAGIASTGGHSDIRRVLTTGPVEVALYGDSVYVDSIENETMPGYVAAYYLKSKSDAFNYLGDAFEVSGVKGLSDEELLVKDTFTGFDFDKVWTMGENGPKLKNIPD